MNENQAVLTEFAEKALQSQGLSYELLPLKYHPTYQVHYQVLRRGADFFMTVREDELRLNCFLNLYDLQNATPQRKLAYVNDRNNLSIVSRFLVKQNEVFATYVLPLPKGDGDTLVALINDALMLFTIDIENVYINYVMSD